MAPESGKTADVFSADEITRIRGRIHGMADKVQGHEIFIEQHRVKIERTEHDVEELRRTMMSMFADIRGTTASRGDLAAATAVIDLKLNSQAEQMKGIKDSIDKSNANTVWLVRLVIGAIVLAIVGFLLNGGAKRITAAASRTVPHYTLEAPGR